MGNFATTFDTAGHDPIGGQWSDRHFFCPQTYPWSEVMWFGERAERIDGCPFESWITPSVNLSPMGRNHVVLIWYCFLFTWKRQIEISMFYLQGFCSCAIIICWFSLILIALGYAGNTLIQVVPNPGAYLENPDSVDWRNSNHVWYELVSINGKVTANTSTQRAMSGYIKDILLGTEGKGNG